MMMGWAGVILAVCLAPIGIWLFDRVLTARKQQIPEHPSGRRRRGDAAAPDSEPTMRLEVVNR